MRREVELREGKHLRLPVLAGWLSFLFTLMFLTAFQLAVGACWRGSGTLPTCAPGATSTSQGGGGAERCVARAP